MGAADAATKLIRRVQVTSYLLPDGQRWSFKHNNGCPGEGKDKHWNAFIDEAGPKTVTELMLLIRGLKGMTGCDGCGLVRTGTVGILFPNTQETSSFVASTISTESNAMSLDTNSSSAVTWPNTEIENLQSSERNLYRNFRSDDSDDEDYVAPIDRGLARDDDVPMTMERGRTTERDRLGDSKWNKEDEPNPPQSQVSLPSTVAYPITNSQSMAMLEELSKIDKGLEVPAVVDEPLTVDHDALVGLVKKLTDRMSEAEKVIGLMRDEIDERRDFEEEINEKGCPRCRTPPNKGKGVDRGNVATPPTRKVSPVPAPAVPRQSAKPTRTTGGPGVVNRPPTNPPKSEVRPAEVPKYKKGLESTWATLAKADNNGEAYSIVSNRKRFAKPVTADPVTTLSERERRLKITWVAKRGVVTTLPGNCGPEKIRTELNECLRNLNERTAYFSVSGKNRFGDVHLTLANTNVEDIRKYAKAMRERLVTLGVPEFIFEGNPKKVRIVVGMVPLWRGGKTSWEAKDWHGEEGFNQLTDDIERSNPGIKVAARPAWLGSLNKFGARRQSTASLKLTVELNETVRQRMASANPTIVIGGRGRFCRMWEDTEKPLCCAKCLVMGHNSMRCTGLVKCKFCQGGHMSSDHQCSVDGCGKRGVSCEHTRKWCVNCREETHFAGDQMCELLRAESTDPRSIGKHSPVRGDDTSKSGVTDHSINNGRNRANGVVVDGVSKQAESGNVPTGIVNILTKGRGKRRTDHSVLKIQKGNAVPRYVEVGESSKGPVVSRVRSNSASNMERKALVEASDLEMAKALFGSFSVC